MRIEGVQFLVVLAGSLLALALIVGWRRRAFSAGAAAGIAALAGAAVWTLDSRRERPPSEDEVADRPAEVRDGGYVSSRTCRACHPHHWTAWHRSYHRTMTQVARPQTVIGAFDGRQLDVLDHTFVVGREGERFFVEIEDHGERPPGGAAPRVRRPIVLTTGSHHMQAYWYATGDRREVELLPFVWLREDRRWIPERASFLKPSFAHYGFRSLDDVPGRKGLWNGGCQQCHATAPQPRLAEMDTRVGELGIACEACHGPAGEHVQANRDPERRYRYHSSGEPDPTIVNPRRLDPQRASGVCGQCHGIWQAIDDAEAARSQAAGFSFRPGDPLERSKFAIHAANVGAGRVQAILRHARQPDPHFLEDRYWPDGMVRVSGREFSGLLDSPCFRDAASDERRLSCLSCHVMHPTNAGAIGDLEEWADDQLKPGMRGDEACLPCHGELRGAARASEHTHHEPGSSGSRCQNCHTPYTTYGLLKAIRSHTVSVPSATESVRLGRPNACNLCHLDRTLAWTAERLEEWWGQPRPELSIDQETVAASLLWLLAGDAGQRALAAWAMGWKEAQEASRADWMAPHLALLVDDPYDAIRYIARRSLRKLPGCTGLDYDFLGSEPERMRAAAEVLARWRRVGGARTTGRAILIDERGEVDRAVAQRLYNSRDDRRVSLEE